MADKKVSELTSLTSSGIANDDVIIINDTSESETKKIAWSEVSSALGSSGTNTTFTVTVAVSGGVNVFYIDGVANPALTLINGLTYTFDVSDNSVSGHPLAFKDASGNSFTTGVTVNGSAGTSGATVVIQVPTSGTQPALYYCTVHGNAMGNTITTPTTIDATSIANGSISNAEFQRLNGVTSDIQTQLDSKQATLTFGISNTNAVKIDSGSVTDDEYARFTANGLESRSTAEVLSDIGGITATSTDTLTNKTIDADGTGNSITNIENANIKASASIDATKIADGSVTSAEFQRLDGVSSDIQGQIDGKQASLTFGIGNTNVPQFTTGVADDDFLRISGTSVEGRSASEVLSDIGGQASLTFGIANTNAVKIDSASVADDEYARFTATGLESRSTSEVLSDIGGQSALTFGIANTNAVKVDSASVANGEYAKFTANGLESRSTAEVASDIGAISTSTILDEDDMASNSATQVASQQSIKAYADTKTTVGQAIAFAIAL